MNMTGNEPLVQGTGNLKHILTTGLPPGVEVEDIKDPGMKALRETQPGRAHPDPDAASRREGDRSRAQRPVSHPAAAGYEAGAPLRVTDPQEEPGFHDDGVELK